MRGAICHFAIGVACFIGVPSAETQKTGAVPKVPQISGEQDLSSTPTDDLLRSAKTLAGSGDFETARKLVIGYLSTHSNSSAGHFLLGHILFKQQKPSESLAEYTEGAKYGSPGAVDLKTVALNYVLLGDYASADHWLTRSVELDPRDAQAWYYLGRTKYNENRFEEAILAFQECLKLDPQNVKAEDNLGLSHHALGRTDNAVAAYRNAMAWQERGLEKIAGPFLNMGILQLEQNRTSEALTFLLQAEAIAPDDSRTHEQLGRAYSRLDSFEKAQTELEKAVALDPNSSSLRFMLGQTYRKRGLMDKAKIELDKGTALKESERKKTPGIE
jgi:tetratricopeptide (TPR) repeat protein